MSQPGLTPTETDPDSNCSPDPALPHADPATSSHLWHYLAWALVAIAAIPLIAGPVWAGTHGWAPESDDAIIALRAHDTFAGATPVVGLPSTLGHADTNTGASHLGPIEFWVLSAPYAISGWSPIGLLVGIALVNVGSVIAVAWLAHRRGGPPLVAAMAIGLALLCWGLGGEPIRSLWNPNIVLLPFVALLAAVLALADDDPAGLPIAAAAGSFVLQTHLSYIGLGGLMWLWAAVLGVLLWRRTRAATHPTKPLRRAFIVSAAVLAVCWAAPIGQQFFGHPGNLGQVFRGLFSGGAGQTAGASGGIVAMGRVVGWPVVGLEPINAQIWAQPAVSAAAVVRWLFPWFVTAGIAAWAWRRRDWRAVRVVATCALLLVALTITAWRVGTPNRLFLTYYVLWLWPAATVSWVVLGASAVRLCLHTAAERRRRSGDRAVRVQQRRAGPRTKIAAGVGAAVALVTTVGITVAPRPSGTWDIPRYRALVHELARPVIDATARQHTIVVIPRGSATFLSTRTGIMAVLDEHGHRTLSTIGYGRKVFPMGAGHRYVGQPADATVWLVSGGDGTPPVPGARRIATADATSPADRATIQPLRDKLERLVRGNGVQLLPLGRQQLHDRAGQAVSGELREVLADPLGALANSKLLTMASVGFIKLPGPIGPYEHFAQLSYLAGPEGHVTAWISPGRPPGQSAGL